MGRLSQRRDGFNGGIKTNTTAYDEHSKKLDRQLKRSFETVARTLTIEGLEARKAVPARDRHSVGCSPDGGVWFYCGVPVAAFEAKKQGRGGNAIERWFKNYVVVTGMNPKVSYVTFCVGEGVRQGGSIFKTLNTAFDCHGQAREWNTFILQGLSMYASEDGFTHDFVAQTMREVVDSAIEAFRNDQMNAILKSYL